MDIKQNHKINVIANTDALVSTLRKDIVKSFLKKKITTTVKNFMTFLKCTSFEMSWNFLWYLYLKFIGIQSNPRLYIWLSNQFKYSIYYEKYHKVINTSTTTFNEHLKLHLIRCITVVILAEKHMKLFSKINMKFDSIRISPLLKYRIHKLLELHYSSQSNEYDNDTITKNILIIIDYLNSQDPDKLFHYINIMLNNNQYKKINVNILLEYLKIYMNKFDNITVLINTTNEIFDLLHKLSDKNSICTVKYLIYEICSFVKMVDSGTIKLKDDKYKEKLNILLENPHCTINTLMSAFLS